MNAQMKPAATAKNSESEKSFFDAVYEQVCKIPAGSVCTYGQIALLCKRPGAARAVGWALHQNPMPGVIPCHRVVNRAGRVAPAFAFGGPKIQSDMLKAENVPFLPDGRVDMQKAMWHG